MYFASVVKDSRDTHNSEYAIKAVSKKIFAYFGKKAIRTDLWRATLEEIRIRKLSLQNEKNRFIKKD